MSEEQNSEFKDLSYEDALKALDIIVNQLEAANLPLEDALTLYSKGRDLAAYCQSMLADVELKLEKLIQNQDGTTSTVPMDLD